MLVAKWRLRLVWAGIAAVVAAVGISRYLGSLQDTVPVVVATKEIPARTAITEDMLTIVHVNRSDRAVLARDAFEAKFEVVGRYARRRIESGEVLRNRSSDLTTSQGAAEFRAEMPLAEVLPPESRAVTLKLDRQAVLDQHLRAGDLVDVVFTSKSDSTGGVYSSLILQQLYVLDIHRPTADDPEQEYLVTLLVYPHQAVDLALAKRTGTVDLVLNPPDPSELVDDRVTSPLQFIVPPEPPASRPADGTVQDANGLYPSAIGR